MQEMQQAMAEGKPKTSGEQMAGMMAMDMGDNAMREQAGNIVPDANNVPNFPQDAYMEGPTMNMEHSSMLDKPENFGLHPGWSSSMQGMMTFLRVLPPDRYDEVLAKMRSANRENDPYATLLQKEGGRA
jgi:hypothetical protein